jgi:hypothetical protein
MQSRLISKISPRTVFGSKGEILELVMSDKSMEHPLFVVVGKANGRKDGESDFGPWTALLGNFRAQALDKNGQRAGELFSSGRCHLPNYVLESTLGQFEEPGDVVEMGYIIGAIYDEQSATSYIYTAKPLFEPAPENDAALALLERAMPSTPALEHKPKKK